MVYTIGESVMDIIYRGLDDVYFRPGGSMLNTSVSLGRLGLPVSHVSFLSSDKISEMLVSFLETNKVNTHYLNRIEQIKTSLALAFLDENNNAEYSFYKGFLDINPKLEFPNIMKNDIVLFGSFFAINPVFHPQLIDFLTAARHAGAVIIYDPNFRKPHLPQLSQLLPLIEQNFEHADIIKGSNEDFKNIYNIDAGDKVWQKLEQFNIDILFYTEGEKGSTFYSPNKTLKHATQPIRAISTIGAGDTFSAGIIYFLNSIIQQKTILEITDYEWDKCINQAHQFATQTCLSIDNYLSHEFIKTLKNV